MAYKIRLLADDAPSVPVRDITQHRYQPIPQTEYAELITPSRRSFEAWCRALTRSGKWFEVVESVPGPVDTATDTEPIRPRS